MFNDSKYTKWYYNLISKSHHCTSTRGYHKHHIIPKSLGGSNDFENIAILTPREHFIAHMLLVKMTSGIYKSKMAFALKRFGGKNTGKSFDTASKLISKAFSGSGNPMFGKPLSEEHRAKIRGEKHGMFGKSCTDIWKEKYGDDIAEQLKADMLAKRSESLRGSKNPQFGKPRTTIQLAKQSNSISGRIGLHKGNDRIRVALKDIPQYIEQGYVISQKNKYKKEKILQRIKQIL